MFGKCFGAFLCFCISFSFLCILAFVNFTMLQPCWMEPKGLSGPSNAEKNHLFANFCRNDTSVGQMEDARSSLCIYSLGIVLALDLFFFVFGWLLTQLFKDCRALRRPAPFEQLQMVKFTERRLNPISFL